MISLLLKLWDGAFIMHQREYFFYEFHNIWPMEHGDEPSGHIYGRKGFFYILVYFEKNNIIF